MFVSKAKHNALKQKCKALERTCYNLNLDMGLAKSNIRLLQLGSMDTMKALLRLNKKTHNLSEIVKLLPTNKERKKVIAVTADGTKITIGDVLDGEDLIPQVEEEYQSAII